MATPPATGDARELRWRLLAGVAGLVLSPSGPARFFRDVLRLGARFDESSTA